MTTVGDVTEIERFEDMRYTAMLHKDLTTLNRLLHDNMIHVHSTGNQHTKADYLKGLEEGQFVYRQIDRSHQEVLLQGPVALVFNHLFLRLTLMGKNIELHNRALTVLVLEKGSWQMLAMQSTLEPSAAQK